MLEQRTIEILAQVVYKQLEPRLGRIHSPDTTDEAQVKESEQLKKNFWNAVKEDTLELARTIIRVNKTINPQLYESNN